MQKRPIYYDTETTGIKSDKDRIIEIAAFDPVRNATFEKLINPKMPIPQEATNIHNITNEMVENAPTFNQIADEWIEFCSGEFYLIAHNNDAFDQLFLEAEFARAGKSIEHFEYIDTLKWARRFRPDLPRHSLQFLREIYGIEENNAHRALDDVIVLHKVFSSMIDDLPLETVKNLLNKPQIITRMPFGKHQGKALQDVPKNYLSWLKDSGAFDKKDNLELKESLEKMGLL